MRSFYDLLHTSAYSGLCGSLMYLGLKAQCSELRSLCRGHRNHDDVPGYRSSLHLLRDHHGSSDDQHQRFWSGASECLEHQVFPDIPMPEIRGFRLPGYLRQKHATAHVCVMQILAQTDTSTSYVGSTKCWAPRVVPDFVIATFATRILLNLQLPRKHRFRV